MSSLIVKVYKVKEVVKHPNADRLSIVTMVDNGWECITGLDTYKIGDLVVYVPPDCIIPGKMIDELGLDYLKKNGRTRTIKLRGYISQGLIINAPFGYKEGDDVALVLGITKYEQPEPKLSTRGNRVSKKRLNPLFDKYTEIENIKNFSNIFEDGELVNITEKCHGSSFRVANLRIQINSKQPLFYILKNLFNKYILRKEYEYVIGSHNVQLVNDKTYYNKNIYKAMSDKYNLIDKIPKDMILYGEVFGPGVQNLTYGLKEIELAVFDIKLNGVYMNWDFVVNFCKEMGLQTVPEIYRGPYNDDLCKKFTTGQSIICPTQIREGIVIKPLIERNHSRLGRVILKSINPVYLLGEEKQ
jgi:RNA ligase (TIGR02306 family)